MEHILSRLAILPIAAGKNIIEEAIVAEGSSAIKSITIIQCDPATLITFKFMNHAQQDLSIKCTSDLFIDCCSIESAISDTPARMLVEYTIGVCDL